MQGVYNAGSPGLFDVPKAYRVVGTVPAPGFVHKESCYLLFDDFAIYYLHGECV